MKKCIMISLSVIFALVILFIPKDEVNATYTDIFNVNQNSSYMSFIENSTTYFERLNEVIDGIQHLTGNYDIFIFTGSSFDYNTNIYLFEKNDSVDYGIFYYKSGSDIVFQSYLLNPNVTSINYYSTSFKLKSSSFSSINVVDSIEQYISSSSNVRSINKSYHDIWRGTISGNYFPYYSSMDIIYGTNGYTGNISYEKVSYSFNDKYITNGDKYMTYYDYLESQTTEFNEIISTNQYSKIEFKFILPTTSSICIKDEYVNGNLVQVEYECPALDLNYNIFSSDKDGNISSMIFGIPYMSKSYLYDTGTMNKTQVDTIPLGNNMSNLYQGNYYVENDTNILELKLVVDLSSIDYSYVNLQFDSNTSFEVVYYERELEKEYIGSVDLTGKAGVMFIPIQIDYDMFLNFGFYQNEYSIQLRDTYKSDFNILKYYSVGYCDDRNYIDGIPYICNGGTDYNISVEFKKGNLEQSLFIVNRDYPKEDKSIVYYDTRYFDYVVYNTLADNPTFKHPITGEDNVSDSLIDFDSSMTEQQGFFDSIMSALNHFKGIIFEIFDNLSYFFENLNIELKYFYIAVFSLIIFAFLIRFLL